MSLTSAVLGVVHTKVNAGLKRDVQRLIPTASGALRRSVVIEVRQARGGIALRVRLLGYFKFQEASGVDGKLIPAVGRLLFQVLRNSLIEGHRFIYTKRSKPGTCRCKVPSAGRYRGRSGSILTFSF